MNGRYSIRREREAPTFPLGAMGVAALAATLAGLFALAMPIGWLESLSFHLYLDTITDLAAPPLGTTARVVAALALAAVAGGVAFAFARFFGVEAMDGGFGGLLDRLRGTGDDDEEDAPTLRSADRHPDAPARRPFSAVRDIPDRGWDDNAAPIRDEAPAAAAPAFAAIDDDEELLLDMAVAPDDVVRGAGDEEDPSPMAASQPVVVGDDTSDPMNQFDLIPPALDDWERPVVEAEALPVAVPVAAPAVATFVAPITSGVEAVPVADAPVTVDMAADPPAPVATQPETAPFARPAARRDVAPLDLSAGRLDELIARLEAGLSRKAAAPTMPDPAPAMAGDGQAQPPVAPLAEAVADDPAFPHDPALAAALATLRKMNLRSA